MKNIVLASSSPFKRQQLEQLGLNFTCVTPDADESPNTNEKPAELALRLAKLKVKTVSSAYPDALIIGCDQTASLNNTLLSKPMSNDRAARQLAMCSEQTVDFYSAVCVLDTSTGEHLAHFTQTKVKFRDLSTKEIDNYLLKEDVRFCAGSFKVESLGISLFEDIQSNDPSALVGLPLIALNKMLITLNCNPLLQ